MLLAMLPHVCIWRWTQRVFFCFVRAGDWHRAGVPSGEYHPLLEGERGKEVHEEDERQPEAPARLRYGERQGSPRQSGRVSPVARAAAGKRCSGRFCGCYGRGGCIPFRTAVPFWGQTTQIPSNLSPKWDCSSKRVNQHTRRIYLKTLLVLVWRSRFGDKPLRF